MNFFIIIFRYILEPFLKVGHEKNVILKVIHILLKSYHFRGILLDNYMNIM